MIFLTAIGVFITLLEIAFAIFKYTKESTRQRQSETIRVFNKLFSSTYQLREDYYKSTGELLFNSEKIHNNPTLLKKTLNHLTLLESFAKGLEYEVYDFKTFIELTPNEFYVILDSLRQFVHDEKIAKSYNLLFSDFIGMTGVMHFCLQKKERGQKIRKKYRQILRRLK